jgi:catechol 2,3-dioxygenase-like lactoylglutathione lyase family enzyme
MTIRRVVPDIKSDEIEKSREFYVDFLGFKLAMDLGWIKTFASPENPSAQVSILHGSAPSPQPDMTIEVADLEAVHAAAVERGIEIVYPLTEEPWGVRRFFVLDPNGLVINLMSHMG